ncbi:MAG: enoyl-CoA hydratase-related protein [Candidatus Hydrogenedentales bacterium]
MEKNKRPPPLPNAPPLHVETRNRATIITLNRPDKLNAFNDAQYDALTAALRDAAADPNVACAVITGAGRAFTAGQDLAELESPPQYTDGQPHGFEPFMDQLQTFPKPLIAAVNGIGVGIGLTMLLHCDIVLMAESARLRAPFVSLGVTTEAGSSALLPARIGWAAASHLLYTASWMSAAEVVATGLAYRAVPDDQLLPDTLGLAEKFAGLPIPSLAATKQLLLAARNDTVHAARHREFNIFRNLRTGPAAREARAAFREKREPNFINLPAE